MREPHVGDLASQSGRHHSCDLARNGSGHRQFGCQRKGFLSVAVAHRRREQRSLALGVAIQRAFGQGECVGHVLHLGALVTVGDEHPRRRGDNRGKPVRGNAAGHGPIIV